MLIKLRFELDQRKFNEEWDKYIDRIHETFKTEMGDQLANSGPIETGEMRANWDYKRNSKHVSTISNSTPQAGYLQGTGVWRPGGGVPFARPTPYYWKATHSVHTHPLVRGVNPHRIGISVDKDLLKLRNLQLNLGLIGPEVDDYKIDTYDFIEDMNTAIRRGWDRTKEAV